MTSSLQYTNILYIFSTDTSNISSNMALVILQHYTHRMQPLIGIGNSPTSPANLLPPSTGAQLLTPNDATTSRQSARVFHCLQQSLLRNEMRLAEQDRRDIVRTEWQQIALVCDRLLLVVFSIVTVLFSVVIIGQAPNARRFFTDWGDMGNEAPSGSTWSSLHNDD